MSSRLDLAARRALRLAASLTFLASGLAVSSPNANAQNGSLRVSVPSPTAASLGKFGDVPVSLYTGVPDISIPLFTAKGRTVELPIVLRYHAAGIRVEEIGGWVGIGWTLDAGGVITRTVRGLADESTHGYLNTGYRFYTSGSWPDPTTSMLDDIRDEHLDGEPDQFFFNFAGRSGQFVMGPTSASPTQREIRTIPAQKLRIESLGALGPFVITSEDGTRYTFDATETNTDYNQTSVQGEPAHYDETYPSSWYLTEIRSPGGDVVSLYYTWYSARHRVGSYRESFHEILGTCPIQNFTVTNEYGLGAQRLDSIKTAAHTVKFSAGIALRSDALSPTGAPQEPRLDKITVTTPAGTVLRVFQLAHDYATGRLTLRSVSEQDRTGAALPPYTLAYDPQTLPAYSSAAQDHWGYYNARSNSDLLPALTTPNGTAIAGADRSPNATSMRAGSLTRITYPTGGYNEFVYEANTYGGIGQGGTRPMVPGPPQRVSLTWTWPDGIRDTTFTIGGTSSVTATIRVSMNPANCDPRAEDGCPITEIDGEGTWRSPGTYYRSLSPGTYTMRIWDNAPSGSATISVEWPGPLVPGNKTAGGLRVAELRTADAMGNITIRKYRYALQSDSTISSGVVSGEPKYGLSYSAAMCSYYSRSSISQAPLGAGASGAVAYREVTVLLGATGQYGKTRHVFRSIQQASDFAMYADVWPFSKRTSYEWKRGQDIQTTEYDASSRAQQRVASTYAFRDEGTPDTATTRRFRGMSVHPFSAGKWGTSYHYGPYEVVSAWSHRATDTTVTFDTTGTTSIARARSYTYGNPSHLELTELLETNSDGVQRITRMKYPADYATGSGNAEAVALTAMQGASHMHSPVIERWVTQRVGGSDSVLQADLTAFKEYVAGQYLPFQRFVLNSPTPLTSFVPSAVTSGAFTKDNRYLLQETANNYDVYGRITQLEDARGKLTDYVYGGNPNNAFLTKVTRVKDPGAMVDLVTDLTYDSLGFLQSIKDEGGSFRRFTYDLFGRLRQIKNHGDTVVKAFGYTYSRTSPSWTFNAASPNAVVDTTFLQQSPTPKSVVSTSFLDGLGRPIQAVVQDGSSFVVTASQYDLMGRPCRSWKPYTRSTAGYDASFSTNATSFYNAYHAASNAKPYVETQYRADALDRVSKVIPEYLGGSPTVLSVHSYGIDVAAKQAIAEVADEMGKKTRSFSDVFGNEVKTILGAGAPEATTTLATFNARGQRLKTTDPRGLITTYSLDTRGLLASKTSPDAGTVASKYDKNANLRYSQDANQAALGQVHFTTYDFANRPLRSGLGAATFASLDPDAGSPPLETTQANWLVVRAYDAKPATDTLPWNLFSAEITPLALANVSGRLAAIASKSNSAWQATLFSYDADGRVATRHTFTQANGGASVLAAVNTQVNYVRDLRDAVTERWLTVGSSTFSHWYDYDARGLLWKVFASTGPGKPATPDVTFTYRPSGQVKDRQFQGGPLVPVRYTIREEIEKIGDLADASLPFSARYAYHPNGTVWEAEFHSPGSPASAKRYKYAFEAPAYDALNRLKGADFSSWNGGSWTSTLAHDLASIGYDVSANLSALQRYRENGTLVDNLTYVYPSGSNRLSSVSDAVGSTPENWDAETGSFTYDANGNLLTAPAPYGISAVSYNHQNLPLTLTSNGVASSYRYDAAGQRIAKQVSGANTEVYALDGASTLGVITLNASGAPVSWHFNVLAADRVIGRQPSAGNRRYYHMDLVGSTRAVVEGAAVVESYDPEPWGLLIPGRTLGSGTKEGFTGKERDAESGLDYFGARLYMAALGRWTSVDPLAEKHPEWSPYNYVLNNPLALFDPDGRQLAARGALPITPIMMDIWRAAGGRTAADWDALARNKGVPLVQEIVISHGMGIIAQAAIGRLGASPRSPAASAAPEIRTAPRTSKLDDVAETAGDVLQGGSKIGGDAAQAAPRAERRFPTKAQRDRVFENSRDAEGVARCEYCGTELERQAGKSNSFQADHVEPWSRGGRTTDENLVASCANCNASKGSKVLHKEWIPPKDKLKDPEP